MTVKTLWGLFFLLGTISPVMATETYDVEVVGECLFDASCNKKMVKMVLPNGLQALVISDPEVQHPSAALSIAVGSWDDPLEYPGMAHFVEHLLFLGTESYPDENSFLQYVQDGGGVAGAFTGYDRSWYTLKAQQEFFDESLKRFSSLFTEPLFTPSSIAREKHAVHHEFEDRGEEEIIRIWRIFKETGNPEHPNAKFSCGNLQTLQSISSKEVRAWFEKHYQPRYMNLVVISKDPLQDITRQVCDYFGKINQKDLARTRNLEMNLSSSKQKGHCIYLEPMLNQRVLMLAWDCIFPKDYTAFLIIEQAFLQKHAHNLERLLKKENLIEDLNADFTIVGQENAVFTLSVDLTEEGVQKVDEVVATCFRVINSLKQASFTSYLEESSSQEGFFDPALFAEDVLEEMVRSDFFSYPQQEVTPPDEVLSQVSFFLNQFNPYNCISFLVAPFTETKVKPSHIEKWMGSEYVIRKISEEKLDLWNSQLPYPDFSLPLLKEESKKADPDPDWGADILNRSIEDDWGSIYLKRPQIEQDSIEAFFSFSSPSFTDTVEAATCGLIFAQNMWGRAEGLDLSFDEGDFQISFQVDKMELESSLDQMVSLLQSHVLTQEEFEESRNLLLMDYPGDDSAISSASELFYSCFVRFHYTLREIYQYLSVVSYNQYLDWQKHKWEYLFIEATISGLDSREELQELWKKVCLEFSCKPYKKTKALIPSTPTYLAQKTHRKASSVFLLLSLGTDCDEEQLFSCVLAPILESAFFSEIRTQKQTAYEVHTGLRCHSDEPICWFSLQSTTYSASDLLERLDLFLENFGKNISTLLTQERFDYIRKGIFLHLQQKKHESDEQEYRATVENKLNKLENILISEVVEKVKEIFSSDNRKKFAVLIEGKKAPPMIEAQIDRLGYDKIDKVNFTLWK